MKNSDEFFFKKAEQEWLTPPENTENNFDGIQQNINSRALHKQSYAKK